MKNYLLQTALLALMTGSAVPLLAQDSTSNMTTQSMNSTTQTTGLQPRTDLFAKKTFRTWSIGAHGGVLTPYTIFRGKTNDFNRSNVSLGYGAFIAKQISPSFGLQANFLAGDVDGAEASTLANSPEYNDSKFKARIKWSAALTADFTVASFNVNRINSYFAPYVKAGAGYMQSNATMTDLGPNTNYNNSWFIPVGAGLKFGVSKGINLDLGYDVNFVKSATFDGLNTGRYDNFSYGHLGIEFALGKASNPQLARYSAIAALRKANKEESEDLRSQMLRAQQDAQNMRDQYARDQAQLAKDLADDDHDGVANKFDKCPNTPADTTVDGSGCPLKIKAPQIQETTYVITEEDRRVVNEAVRNLEFDLGKATIRQTSDSSLNKLAQLLQQKNVHLKLAGYTDNIGSPASNLRLSKDRAEAVKSYLVSQGADASKIQTFGYGQSQPIASNKTAAGRQKNRRVEFTLY